VASRGARRPRACCAPAGLTAWEACRQTARACRRPPGALPRDGRGRGSEVHIQGQAGVQGGRERRAGRGGHHEPGRGPPSCGDAAGECAARDAPRHARSMQPTRLARQRMPPKRCAQNAASRTHATFMQLSEGGALVRRSGTAAGHRSAVATSVLRAQWNARSGLVRKPGNLHNCKLNAVCLRGQGLCPYSDGALRGRGAV
jgi:hypothetical protein